MYPADFGNSTCFESVDSSAVPDAVATLMTLLSHVHYRGVFSAEFKRDARDGVCRLIEVNARPWWYVEFAGQCGVNVCAMSVLDALGEEVPETIGYRVGKSCVYPYYDYFACRELHARGELTAGEWLWSWLRSTQPVLRWSDPFPALSEAASLVKRRASSYLRRAS
jgi:predicted ATP-grasp superfamily ATP-dependent carboligase